jgi:hypothetical protein
MFFLITGASGAGKSTIRKSVEAEFAGLLEAAELAELGGTPQWSLLWRHKAVEKVVQRALQVQREGKHFLLCGDPVPTGELYAAPSADQLDGIAVCLLDVSAAVQRSRLMARGDDPALFPRHTAFADWMREHVVNPGHRPEVIVRGGWEEMRWDRWLRDGEKPGPWNSHIIDTSDLDSEQVARRAAAWIRRVLESTEGSAHTGSSVRSSG